MYHIYIAIRYGPCGLYLNAIISVQLRLDIVYQIQDFKHDRVFVHSYGLIHFFYLESRICLDARSHVLLRTHVLGFEVTELFLSFLSILLDLILSFLLGLLQTTCLTFPGVRDLLRGALLGGQKLLNTLRLAGHLCEWRTASSLSRIDHMTLELPSSAPP